jgi:sterol 3beta-glucosyltransferase
MDIQPSLGRTQNAALSLVDLMAAATELSAESEGEDEEDAEEDDVSPTLPNNPIHQFTTPVNPVKLARPAPPIRGASFQFVDQETVKSSVLKSLLGDEVDMIELAAERRQTVDSIFSGETAKPAVVDPKERYRKIVESYGEWCDDSEYFIESIPAALYRGVLIKGLASLTNRRLLFFAYVPEALPGVVRSGAVRISYPGTPLLYSLTNLY